MIDRLEGGMVADLAQWSAHSWYLFGQWGSLGHVSLMEEIHSTNTRTAACGMRPEMWKVGEIVKYSSMMGVKVKNDIMWANFFSYLQSSGDEEDASKLDGEEVIERAQSPFVLEA